MQINACSVCVCVVHVYYVCVCVCDKCTLIQNVVCELSVEYGDRHLTPLPRVETTSWTVED